MYKRCWINQVSVIVQSAYTLRSAVFHKMMRLSPGERSEGRHGFAAVGKSIKRNHRIVVTSKSTCGPPFLDHNIGLQTVPPFARTVMRQITAHRDYFRPERGRMHLRSAPCPLSSRSPLSVSQQNQPRVSSTGARKSRLSCTRWGSAARAHFRPFIVALLPSAGTARLSSSAYAVSHASEHAMMSR